MRTDPVTGATVEVVATRQLRPNLPTAGCPFCVGGLESPEAYVGRAFADRWPSFDHCEVVLYGPEHGTALAALGVDRARLVVDLWAQRTDELGALDDVAYVLVFENHGPEVGATIDHPHGQVHAYPAVPPTPANVLARLAGGAPLLEDVAECVVVERDGWRAWVPWAATHPHQVRLAPLARRPDLPCPDAWRHLELVSPWRAAGVARFVAAGELGGGVLVNPVDPLDAAARLRAAG